MIVSLAVDSLLQFVSGTWGYIGLSAACLNIDLALLAKKLFLAAVSKWTWTKFMFCKRMSEVSIWSDVA